MVTNSTLDELSSFSQNEQNVLSDLGLVSAIKEVPNQQVVANLLAYSKALSVRQSSIIGKIETVLN